MLLQMFFVCFCFDLRHFCCLKKEITTKIHAENIDVSHCYLYGEVMPVGY